MQNTLPPTNDNSNDDSLRKLLRITTLIIFPLLIWTSLWGLTGENAMYDGKIFPFFIIFLASYIGGEVVSLAPVGLPPLLGMIINGFLLTNFTPIRCDQQISSIIRNIALTIILLRAGLGLDPITLKKLSAVCFRLAFLPCLVETLTCGFSSHFIIGLPLEWGFLLGFVLAAVSPAVVVPGMILLSEKKLGTDKGIPTLVIAAASVDDVLAITGFGVLLSIVFNTEKNIPLIYQIAKGPIEAVSGLVIGIIIGLILWFIPDNLNKQTEHKQRFALFLMSGISAFFVPKSLNFSGAGALAVLALSFTATLKWRGFKHEVQIEDGLKFLWQIFAQPFLFGLIGAEVDISNLNEKEISLSLLVLIIGLVTRCLTSYLVVWGADFTWKEKIFISLAW